MIANAGRQQYLSLVTISGQRISLVGPETPPLAISDCGQWACQDLLHSREYFGLRFYFSQSCFGRKGRDSVSFSLLILNLPNQNCCLFPAFLPLFLHHSIEKSTNLPFSSQWGFPGQDLNSSQWSGWVPGLSLIYFYLFWWCWGLNPGTCACQAHVLPLGHISRISQTCSDFKAGQVVQILIL